MGFLSLCLLKLKNEDPGLPAFAALAAQIVMTAAGWADAGRLCLTRFPSDDIAPVCVCDLFPARRGLVTRMCVLGPSTSDMFPGGRGSLMDRTGLPFRGKNGLDGTAACVT